MTTPVFGTARATFAFLFAMGCVLSPGSALADHHKVSPVGVKRCSNNTTQQLVQVVMDSAGENLWANCIRFDFRNSAGALNGQVLIQNDPPSGPFVVSLTSNELAATPGAPSALQSFPSSLMTAGGQVCYTGIPANSHPSGVGCRSVSVCMPVSAVTCGCDGLPGSGTVVDACGVCGGNGSSCAATCGDGIVEAGEQCDDGNAVNGDCCSSSCTFETGPCDDGDACTVADSCAVGVCVAGTARNCGDGNVCTDDSCDSANGCVNVANSAACQDGNACTTGDICFQGLCTGGGLPDCDDGNPCTDDGCDAGTGCTNLSNANACDDGDECTVNDLCQDGVCSGSVAPGCGGVCGDVNGDVVANITDALLISQLVVGLRQCDDPLLAGFDRCDVNPDGVCSIADALRIAQCDVGLIGCDFPCAPVQCVIP